MSCIEDREKESNEYDLIGYEYEYIIYVITKYVNGDVNKNLSGYE